jgi:hypothetical protein
VTQVTPTVALAFILPLLGTFAKICEKRILASKLLSVRLSAHTEQLGFAGRIFMEFIFEWFFFRKPSEKNAYSGNPTKVPVVLREEICIFVKISRRILLRMKNILDKFTQKIKTQNLLFLLLHRAF